MKVFCILILLLGNLIATAQTEKSYRTDTLVITGSVQKPLTLTAKDLMNFDVVTLDSVRIVNHRGEYKNTLRNVEGIFSRNCLIQP